MKAGRVADLKSRIEGRLEQPLSKLSCHVLMVTVALESQDDELARSGLADLHKQLESDPLRNNAELACHAALPALARDPLAATAAPVVEAAAQRLATQGQTNADPEPGASLLMALGRYYLRQKNSAAGQKTLSQYLEVYQRSGARYGGDYGSYLYKAQMGNVALEFAQAGLIPEALELLGRYADLPRYQQYGEAGIAPILHLTAQSLSRLPAQKRYELLKAWTLPSEKRQAVRILADFAQIDHTPDAFQSQAIWNRLEHGALTATDPAAGERITHGGAPRSQYSTGEQVVSTVDLLIDAARETNRLPELAADLDEPVAKKLDQAQIVAWLVAMAREDRTAVKPALDQFIADSSKGQPAGQARDPIDWTSYLLARAARRSADLREPAERLLRQLIPRAESGYSNTWMTRLKYDLGATLVERNSSDLVSVANQGLGYWHPASLGSDTNRGHAPSGGAILGHARRPRRARCRITKRFSDLRLPGDRGLRIFGRCVS